MVPAIIDVVRPEATPARLATLLAFTAGYVDTLGFMSLFGLFMAHVTGNFILIGAELAVPRSGVLIKFVAFPAFVLGVAAATVLTISMRRRGRQPAPVLLGLQGTLLLALMLIGIASTPLLHASDGAALVAGTAGAV